MPATSSARASPVRGSISICAGGFGAEFGVVHAAIEGVRNRS
jgi:hypothetical protein